MLMEDARDELLLDSYELPRREIADNDVLDWKEKILEKGGKWEGRAERKMEVG